MRSNSLYSILAALIKAEGVLGSKTWIPKNDEQQKLIKFMEKNRNDIAYLNDINTIATKDYTKLNNFLHRYGYTIDVKPFGNDSFGVAANQSILVEWLQMGLTTQVVTKNQQTYPAVRLKKGVSFYSIPGRNYPLVRVETKTGDFIWFTVEDFPTNNFDLIYFAQAYLESANPIDSYDEVIVPMINFFHQQELTWLHQFCAVDKNLQKYFVTQARQQNSFKLNEVGASAKSGSAIVLTRSSGDIYTINKPFLVWVERPSVKYPIFTAYIATDFWKNPGLIV